MSDNKDDKEVALERISGIIQQHRRGDPATQYVADVLEDVGFLDRSESVAKAWQTGHFQFRSLAAGHDRETFELKGSMDEIDSEWTVEKLRLFHPVYRIAILRRLIEEAESQGQDV